MTNDKVFQPGEVRFLGFLPNEPRPRDDVSFVFRFEPPPYDPGIPKHLLHGPDVRFDFSSHKHDEDCFRVRLGRD